MTDNGTGVNQEPLPKMMLGRVVDACVRFYRWTDHFNIRK
jgi:hypothetical protein